MTHPTPARPELPPIPHGELYSRREHAALIEWAMQIADAARADGRRKALELAKGACWKVAMPQQATGAMVALECATRIQDLIEEEPTK
jgi:hypothetical protein